MDKRFDRKEMRPEGAQSRPAEAALRFGGGRVAVAGVLAGLGIALGVPAILLSLGQSLGQVVLTILVVIALAGGALVCLVSAFFGLVIPRHLHHGPWMDPDKWRRFAMAQRRLGEMHREHRRRAWQGGPWGPSEGFRDEEDEQDEQDEERGREARPRAAGAPRTRGRRRRT